MLSIMMTSLSFLIAEFPNTFRQPKYRVEYASNASVNPWHHTSICSFM